MSKRLSGKKALITGGASGIGAATAKRFIEEGAHVVIADLNVEKGRALASTSRKMSFKKLDVTKPSDWDAVMKYAVKRLDGLTTVINSAGVSIPGSIEDMSLEDFRKTLAINLEGTFMGTQAAIRALKDGSGGAIVNIASTMAHRGVSFAPQYCASKAGVLTLTRASALHCAENKYDIRINTISPGAIHTEMVEGYIDAGIAAGASRDDVINGFADGHPLKRLGTPDEPANAIVYLASDESSYCTGIDIPVDGGYLA